MATTTISQGHNIPLAPVLKDELNTDQWAVLAAIFDTVIPSFVPGKGNYLIQHPLSEDDYNNVRQRIAKTSSLEPQSDLLTLFMNESATSSAECKESVNRLLGDQMDKAAAAGFRGILSILR